MSYSHRAKNIISIKDFRVGTRTYGDTEAQDAQGKFAKIQNCEIDKPGMLYKRDPAKYITTTDTVISQIKKWFNSKLVDESWNSENNESCWIAFGINVGSDKIGIWNATTFGWEASLATLGAEGGTCQIIPFANDIRFTGYDASGILRDASIWSYNYDTDFFDGEITGVTPGFIYGDAHLGYPDTWEYVSITDGSFGTLPVGHYYYKFVPVYDGVQEMELGTGYAYHYADNQHGNTLTINFKLKISEFNKRIKAIKVYRGYAKENIEIVYNHISTFAINESSGSVGSEFNMFNVVGADDDTGEHEIIIVDPDMDFSGYTDSYGVKFYDLEGEPKIFSFATGHLADGYAGLHPTEGLTFSDVDRLWLGHYSIIQLSNEEQQNAGDSGCIGNNVLYATTGGEGDDPIKNNFLTNYKAHIDQSGLDMTILGNYGNIIQLSAGHGVDYSTGISVDALTQRPTFNNTGTYIEITFHDIGFADGAEHPLDGITKTKMNYRYGALHNGRLFKLHISLDPDNENEIHENWLGYSEFNQYDTDSVTNVIPLVDKRGGVGTGVISVGGYLIVFTETGVFRVDVPTVDPYGWKVEQGIETMGCTAPDSIIEAEGIAFFANATGIWALTPGDFMTYEISYDIKDQYLAVSNYENTRITYDPHKRRLICRFGDTIATQHIFDLEMFLANHQTVWTTQMYDKESTSAHSAPSLAVIDEDLKLYGISYWTNGGTPSTGFSQLYGHANGVETLQAIITTSWLSIDDIDFNIIWRRLNLVLKQLADATNNDLENITINIYQDKFNTIDSLHGATYSFSANAEDYTSLIVIEEVIRLAMRSTFLKIEIITTKTASNDFELHRIEAILDD